MIKHLGMLGEHSKSLRLVINKLFLVFLLDAWAYYACKPLENHILLLEERKVNLIFILINIILES